MKVAELIAALRRLNPDAEVVFPQGEFDDLEPVSFVGVDPDGSKSVVLDDSDYRWQCTNPQPYRETDEWLTEAVSLLAKAHFDLLKGHLGYLNSPKGADSLRIRINKPQGEE